MTTRALRVLVADDEAEIVHVLTALLEDEGVTVLTASRGDQALTLVRQERPDLVLSDVMMPGLNGPELCRQIKADPELAGIPIVLMSAVHKLDLRDCDEDAFLPKPFDVDTVLVTINRLLAGTG